ncbi:hypothetical protein [Dysosmobacter sp.]|uniref:hypothetical protein n=1 Tax=Dysosmobacter sp. TaxID=2591382 RepID=UPI002A8D74C2|nr:hypothetical protein [Dysosmobacter sp.]MDY3281170.1 hypothetical protein [Dysosmobacter sp.]
MEEKTIISSKQANIKGISLVIVLVGIILFILVVLNAASSGFYLEKIVRGQWDYVLLSMVPYFGAMTLLPFAVIAASISGQKSAGGKPAPAGYFQLKYHSDRLKFEKPY